MRLHRGYFADCSEQDGNVNAAKIDAAFHNTVTIFDSLGADTNKIVWQINIVGGQVAAVDTHLTNVDTDLTNVDNHVTAEFVTLNANLTNLLNLLTTQVANSTALTSADLKQVMKLELTPDGQKKIVPAILTCTGTDCPNVLNKCPAAGCSWNNVGPLP